MKNLLGKPIGEPARSALWDPLETFLEKVITKDMRTLIYESIEDPIDTALHNQKAFVIEKVHFEVRTRR